MTEFKKIRGNEALFNDLRENKQIPEDELLVLEKAASLIGSKFKSYNITVESHNGKGVSLGLMSGNVLDSLMKIIGANVEVVENNVDENSLN